MKVHMDNYEAYVINMDKDVGRRYLMTDIMTKFNAKIWKGYDGNIIKASNGSIDIKWTNREIATEAAKRSKKELLTYFINNSTKKYLLVLEDDISLHVDCYNDLKYNKWLVNLNKFLTMMNVNILYLGVSRHIKSKKESIDNHIFESFNDYFKKDPQKCSGAYGFIINRDIIPIALARIDNKSLYGKPFDLTCLGYISVNNPDTTYIMHPPLVIPRIDISNIREPKPQEIFWKAMKINKSLYNVYESVFALCVWIDTDSDIKNIDKILNSIKPFISIWYFSDNIKNNMKNLNNLKKCSYKEYLTENINRFFKKRYTLYRISSNKIDNYYCGNDILKRFNIDE